MQSCTCHRHPAHVLAWEQRLQSMQQNDALLPVVPSLKPTLRHLHLRLTEVTLPIVPSLSTLTLKHRGSQRHAGP